MEYGQGDDCGFSVAPPPTNLEEQATQNPVPFSFGRTSPFSFPNRGSGGGGTPAGCSTPGFTPTAFPCSPTIGALRPSSPLEGKEHPLDSVLSPDMSWSYCYAGPQDHAASYQLDSGGWLTPKTHTEARACEALASGGLAEGSGGNDGNSNDRNHRPTRSKAPLQKVQACSETSCGGPVGASPKKTCTAKAARVPEEDMDMDTEGTDTEYTADQDPECRPVTRSERTSSSSALLNALLTRNPPSAAARREGGVATMPDRNFNLRSGILAASPLVQGGKGTRPEVDTPVVVVKARYPANKGSILSLAVQSSGMIMTETRREWMTKIKSTISGTVKGHICAHGSVHDTSGPLRDLIVVAPDKSCMPSSDPLLRVDVRRLTQVGKELCGIDPPLKMQSDKVGPPLGRPSFSPFVTGVCALATEQHPMQADKQGSLWIVQASRNGNFAASAALKCPEFQLDEPVSAMEWLGTKELLVASGKHMLVLSVNNTVRKRTVMPQMHEDDIRDIQLSNFQRNLCLSGGYDGSLFITDCERVVSDQLSWRSQSKNTLYSTGSAISSVAWNPVMAHFASTTTDSGCLHCFDSRLEGSEKPTIVIETGYEELYSHSWADAYGVLLGFGNGFLRLFDIRKAANCVVSFQDPHLEQCGDLAFDPQRRYFVACGSPNFSVWRNEASALSLWYTDPKSVSSMQVKSDAYYKNAGAWMLTGGRQHAVFGVTDAHGFFSLYDVNAAGDGAIDISQPVQGHKAKGARR